MIKNKAKNIIIEVIGLMSSLIILIPLLTIIFNSFKSTKEANKLALSLYGVSMHQIVENYIKVFKITNLHIAFLNSILVTFFSVFLIIIVTSMMSFVIQRRKDFLSEAVNYLLVSGMMLPASIVCQFYIIKSLRLNGSIIGAILVFAAVNLSLATFIYTGFYKSIPRDIDESAVLDGCGPFRLFFRIIFPLLKPATATIVIITSMSIWNNFSVSIFFLNSPKRYTAVTTMFSFFGAHSSDWNLLFADITLLSIPIVILYLALQKYIIAGMTSGSVKA